MTDQKPQDSSQKLEQALKNQPEPDLQDQGDIAADDAGATAMAERVTNAAGVQGEDDLED